MYFFWSCQKISKFRIIDYCGGMHQAQGKRRAVHGAVFFEQGIVLVWVAVSHMSQWVTELPKYVVYTEKQGGLLRECGELGDGILEPAE